MNAYFGYTAHCANPGCPKSNDSIYKIEKNVRNHISRVSTIPFGRPTPVMKTKKKREMNETNDSVIYV